MEENKKRVPELRFPEFTDEWEERKLGQSVDVRSGRDYQHLSEGDIPVYGTGGYMLSVNEALSYSEDAIGIGRKGTIDKPYILKAPFWTVDTLFYAVPKENYDLNFIFCIFQNIDWKKKDESTGVPSLSKIAINGIDILIPKIDEQKIIGIYFAKLDNLITLHQHKLEHWKEVKKGLLQKMFPKKGSNVPEVRFPEFTDEWEERKLDNVADVRDGTHDSPQYVDEGHPFITSKNVKNGYINYDDIQFISNKDYEEINKRSKVDKNDILMGMIGTIGNIALVRENPDFAIKNVALIKDRNEVYYYYLYHCLQSSKITNQLSKNLDGGTQKFVALNKIRELDIPIPIVEEQYKIGNYFEQLDNLIILHQRKLDHLKELKKGLLQKMFV